MADLLLLVVALIWGTSYGVVKNALLVYPVLGLLALRFGITFFVLLPALRGLIHLRRRDWAAVTAVGLILLGIFLAETIGVSLTSASNAAFLISLCVVATPLVEWAWLKRAPRPLEWAAGAISLLGAFLLGGGAFVFSWGDALILLAALLRAVNVCATKRVMRDRNLSPLMVTSVQAGVVSFGCIALMLAISPEQLQPLPSLTGHSIFWGSLLYLVTGCTLLAFFVQNYAVNQSSPTRVALLMGSEPVFGAIFASLWLGERLSVLGWVGGGLIVAASLLATVGSRDAPKSELRPRTKAAVQPDAGSTRA
ncbi:hypothetical protein LMG26411_07439 [Cupriavidus numazuensis]|uniref:EamA domain-containing protein n=1 Tax=Cupriavidus numazuensis TaxID=221992 RepID=A0ABN7QAC3_9BURK|nr:hypothetical protein LMG26411_07439 [Cupriavidus numazuensis]